MCVWVCMCMGRVLPRCVLVCGVVRQGGIRHLEDLLDVVHAVVGHSHGLHLALVDQIAHGFPHG